MFSLIIFTGILFPWQAFLLFTFFLSINVRKNIRFFLPIISLILRMLGWFLYFFDSTENWIRNIWVGYIIPKIIVCVVIWYDITKAYNASFHQKLEFLQYNACLAIFGAIRSTSREKLYKELRLESLQLRRRLRKLCCFYKLFKSEHPHYLFKLISSRSALFMLLEIYIIWLSLKQDKIF